MQTRLTLLSTSPKECDASAQPHAVDAPRSLDFGLAPAPASEAADGKPAYWLCARAPGAATPAVRVWGLWMDGGIVFSTDTESVAAGDAASFHATLVQADGDGVSLVEGSRGGSSTPGALRRFASQCAAKYGFEPDPDDPDTPIYALAPT